MAALARLLPQLGISGVGLAAVASGGAAPGLIGRSNREARAFGGGGAKTAPDEPSVEVRFFFSTGPQITEDPVTGSFNASMAQWLIAEGHAPASYTAAQGRCLGVEGRVHIAQDPSGQVWVGGDVVTCVDGQVLL